MNKLFAGLLTIAMIIVLIGLEGLVMWWLGRFVIDTFQLDYIWTYSHGLAVSLILMIIKRIFK